MEKRIKCSQITGQILNHVPAEIIDESLYKLPVKSLLRFKCVSKQWRCFISSKGFIKEHLKKSKTATDFAHHNLIFRFCLPVDLNIVGSCCIGSLLNDDNNYIDDEPNPNCLGSNLSTIRLPALEDNKDSFHIDLCGSCNGLILVTINWRELYLWNPSTRKAKNIINASFRQETSAKHTYRRGYGLGYDESTDEYKVVCIVSSVGTYLRVMYMYSSRTDSWKKFMNFDQKSLPRWPAKFVNGKLHCLTNQGEHLATPSWYIISLDLVDEKYQLLPLPLCFLEYDSYLSLVLEDLGGYLSLFHYQYIMERESIDVWVMVKPGEKECWAKIWSFSQFDNLPCPLWLKKNRDIVATFRSGLVIYRGKDKLHQYRVHDKLYNNTGSIIYIESLVSPFGDDEQLHQ